METFFSEYGFIFVTIIAVGFFFITMVVLLPEFNVWKTALVADVTGLSVQKLNDAETQWSTYAQEYENYVNQQER